MPKFLFKPERIYAQHERKLILQCLHWKLLKTSSYKDVYANTATYKMFIDIFKNAKVMKLLLWQTLFASV